MAKRQRITAAAAAAVDRDEVNLTPMLDVVFIMLIFFIVTATFIRESGLPAERANDSLSSDSESEVIHIVIDSDNEIWLDGNHADPLALKAQIAGLHAIHPDWPVVIEPRPASTTKMLVRAMDAARQSGVPQVSIASVE